MDQVLSAGFNVEYYKSFKNGFVLKPYTGLSLNQTVSNKVEITADGERKDMDHYMSDDLAVKAGLKESVMNVCSVGGIKPSHYMGAYNISKAGLIYMTKQLAMELAPDIRVNGIAPGVVKTKLSEMLWAGDEQGSADLHALKKLGVPEDIASLIYYLSSDDASWITGEVVTIDGGFLL